MFKCFGRRPIASQYVRHSASLSALPIRSARSFGEYVALELHLSIAERVRLRYNLSLGFGS